MFTFGYCIRLESSEAFWRVPKAYFCEVRVRRHAPTDIQFEADEEGTLVAWSSNGESLAENSVPKDDCLVSFITWVVAGAGFVPRAHARKSSEAQRTKSF